MKRLTDTPGYDAEGTVCGKDGSIVFTSVRDGDIDLYRMDADGGNVRRLTSTVGCMSWGRGWKSRPRTWASKWTRPTGRVRAIRILPCRFAFGIVET